MNLQYLLEKVESRESFYEFLCALLADKTEDEQKEKINASPPYGPTANGWENTTLTQFLESIKSFMEDTSQIPQEPQWYSFAMLLFAGKSYE